MTHFMDDACLWALASAMYLSTVASIGWLRLRRQKLTMHYCGVSYNFDCELTRWVWRAQGPTLNSPRTISQLLVLRLRRAFSLFDNDCDGCIAAARYSRLTASYTWLWGLFILFLGVAPAVAILTLIQYAVECLIGAICGQEGKAATICHKVLSIELLLSFTAATRDPTLSRVHDIFTRVLSFTLSSVVVIWVGQCIIGNITRRLEGIIRWAERLRCLEGWSCRGWLDADRMDDNLKSISATFWIISKSFCFALSIATGCFHLYMAGMAATHLLKEGVYFLASIILA